MEILRFDEADAPAPKRKRPSKAWLALSLVAALMGVGTAFASSTININTNNLASLGQGVASVVGCDDSINLVPASGVVYKDEAPAFQLTSIEASDIDLHSKLSSQYSNAGKGCGNSTLELQVFSKVESEDPVALTCQQLYGDSPSSITLTGSGWKANAECINGVPTAGGTAAAIYFDISNIDTLVSGTDADDLTKHTTGTVTISGLKWSGDVSYMTLVSLDSHTYCSPVSPQTLYVGTCG